MKELNVALLGLGTVGSGVVKIIEENRQQIKDTLNKDIVIKHILVRDTTKKRPINISQYHLTEDINEILNDDDIDIVIEVMGGIEPTVDWLRESLKRKKHVITANKDLLAVHLELLENLAEQQGVALKFEASVAGGIPIVNAINNGLNANNISKFMGILNGTSNFILSKMTREQTSFEDALAEAQRLGFAEADPTDDVEGIDAARKVVITSYLSFNQVIKLNDVKVKGISKTTLSDINVADKLGYKIKLIGKSTYHHREVNASVEPTLIHKSHQLAAVENEYNAIYVIGDAVGDTMFYGKGAGSLATGSAVVSDLLNVALFFESNLHTLPPHFELKTNKTRELMDNGDAIAIGEKLNYYVVIHSDESIDKLKDQLKSDLPFHKSLQIEQRDSSSYGVVVIGLDQSPESLLSKANYNIEKIYPVEGV
ncbi:MULTISPECIES: homoserine dehydrogenase [Staphylococcus]|jgi:homoserine dehydrogenase|uniref:Homoserine dehydrogenase n=3 Tax=Staphylococcus TaxID=1279 RepID=A0A4Q9WNC2_STAHO|nr:MULTISPECIES: homoserine dehydrogenase [Staphylococcus]EUZ70280.1 homoserine dehydrogenase [Staphylococcus sp. M0480]OFK82925.1 homoserine dehydrogenase [Staphylococcus sp. HMSC057A02]OFM63744.1 homoserine dehydrogenase [Staphylococcus sp. HMSC062C01]OFM79687.1 homoserine dehydrogenase [Staphylococcus sp. HMSC074B09]OFR36092.1 homoserine dehydrogenase [Staphylococcus sp. HMSC063F02]OFS49843.1 homoserine dehydrogenase [Staphylococcus sp. HMSC075H09]OHO57440.1 homoserine dehydrogenase [Stap